MKRDDVLTQICARAAEMLQQVPQENYAAATLKYNHIRRLARSIMGKKPTVPKTYSYKPELRAGKHEHF